MEKPESYRVPDHMPKLLDRVKLFSGENMLEGRWEENIFRGPGLSRILVRAFVLGYLACRSDSP